jgi:hypothetical protein
VVAGRPPVSSAAGRRPAGRAGQPDRVGRQRQRSREQVGEDRPEEEHK